MASWGALEWTITILGSMGVVLMFAAQVGPKQAVSHTADWIEVFVRVPAWLRTTETDRVVRHIAALILLVSASLILIQMVDLDAMNPVPKAIFGLAAFGIAAAIVLNLTQPSWIGKLQTPAFFLVCGLTVALIAAVWQWRATSPVDPRIGKLESQVLVLQEEKDAAIKKAEGAEVALTTEKQKPLLAQSPELDAAKKQLSESQTELAAAKQQIAKFTAPQMMPQRPGALPPPRDPYPPGQIIEKNLLKNEAKLMIEALVKITNAAAKAQELEMPGQFYPNDSMYTGNQWTKNIKSAGFSGVADRLSKFREGANTLTESIESSIKEYSYYSSDLRRIIGNTSLDRANTAIGSYLRILKELDALNAMDKIDTPMIERNLKETVLELAIAMNDYRRWKDTFVQDRSPNARRELEKQARND